LVDVTTNRVYMRGEPFDPTRDPSEYHDYLLRLGPRYDAAGRLTPEGPFSMAMGWDFGGSGHFAIDATVTSVQIAREQAVTSDPVVGRAVDLWGHYNEYLGTTFGRARVFDVDPASNWTSTLMIGQLNFGRLGSSTSVPNWFGGPVTGTQPARWQSCSTICELPAHCLASEFARSAVHQFVVEKSAPDVWWGDGADSSPGLEALQAALAADDTSGLVIQLGLANMSAPLKPDMPVFMDVFGTIGVWRRGEMRSYPAGRLLVPARGCALMSNLSVQANADGLSLNMVTAVPWRGRAREAGPGPTHMLGPKLDLGALEVRTLEGDRLLARIPSELYASDAHRRTSGVVDVSWERPWSSIREELGQRGLYITGRGLDGERRRLLVEQQVHVQTDRAAEFLEYPDPQGPDQYDEEFELRSFVRGEPRAAAVHVRQFYNPRALPQLRSEHERTAIRGQAFHYPRNVDLRVVGLRSGHAEGGGAFAPEARVVTDEQGRGMLTVRGLRPGTAQLLLGSTDEYPCDPGDPDEAVKSYDNENATGIWPANGSIALRVLTDDWHLLAVSSDAVDYDFVYQNCLAFYEHAFSFMKLEVFSLADRCKAETYARLMWQMCDPTNKPKTYYMPPTRDFSLPRARLLRTFLDNLQRVRTPPALHVRSHRPLVTGRDALVAALRDAAELEMAVMLQYIYAGYSVPTHSAGREYVRRGVWTNAQLELACGDGQEAKNFGMRGVLLKISRQEMIHFLLVNNVLMAMGEPFFAPAPDFPTLRGRFSIETELALEPLTLSSVARFIQLEWPERIRTELAESRTPSSRVGYRSLSELYALIRDGLKNVPGAIQCAKGKAGSEHHLFLPERLNRAHPDYQLQVDDVDSALFAIDLITEQGEGLAPDRNPSEDSHFEQFRRMATALTAAQSSTSPQQSGPWCPAYPVLRNPTLRTTTPDGTTVSDPEARQVLELFSESYELMLFLMIEHFALTPGGSLRRSKLMNAAIDVMSGLMRPLGELLATMPSGVPGRTAGASFEARSPTCIPDPVAACRILADRFTRAAAAARRTGHVERTVCDLFDFYAGSFASHGLNPHQLKS
jgi:hypothetical protein